MVARWASHRVSEARAGTQQDLRHERRRHGREAAYRTVTDRVQRLSQLGPGSPMIRCRVAFLLALVGIASPSAARSQAIITLDGLVREAGGGIGSAHVVAVDSLTNERRSVMTNERGFFRILDLSPGDYVVSVRAIGYAPATQAIHVVVGER